MLAVALIAAACATTGSQDASRGGDRDRLTAEQVRELAPQFDTAYDLVRNVRPLWLRIRGATSPTTDGAIALYVDGARYGTSEDLRRISVTAVESMRYLSPSDATNRYGTGHVHGAILVTTRR